MRILSKNLRKVLHHKLTMLRKIFLFIFPLVITACSSSQVVQSTSTEASTPVITNTSILTAIPSATSTPQPRLSQITYGPEAAQFRADLDQVSGGAVEDPSFLRFP